MVPYEINPVSGPLASAKVALYRVLKEQTDGGKDLPTCNAELYRVLSQDPTILAFQTAYARGMSPEEFVESFEMYGTVELP
jgi:hypothetical protein